MDYQQQPARTSAANGSRHALDARHIGAWSALIGSVLYLGVFTLEGWLRSDYDAASMFISELSLGPWGWVQIANFMIFGLSILVFAICVAVEFGTTRTARVGVTLLVIIAISMIASGPFVIDPVSAAGPVVIDPAAVTPPRMSFASKFHYALGTLAFMLTPATCLCFAGSKQFRRDATWRAFIWWSLGLGIVSLVGVIGLKLALLPPASNPLLPWRGLIERASVVPFLIWLFIFGLMMLKHARSTEDLANPRGATISAVPQSSPQSAASDLT